jgi:nucleotide-binding universal stress UspA family protein
MMIGQRMSNYHHIIVPVDGSTPANKAAGYARELAGTQCRLTFVCAVDVNRIYGQTIRTPFSNPTPVIEANEKEAHRIVDALVSRATRIHRRANGMVMEGEPAVAVLQAAENIDADLIVLSTHGRSGIARLLLGSVAEGIIRKSRLPVLIVPSGMEPDHPDKHLHQILSGA